MSEFEHSPSQKKAIDERGHAVLVSAGAGSGKTSVLVDRLASYVIKDGFNADDFVIITFTKAAAGELRARISSKFADLAKENPSDSHIRQQLAFCTKAKIGTIHSFCAQLLRQYSKDAGVSPDFKVISQERCDALKKATAERVFDRCYRDMGSREGFEDLVNTAGSGVDDSSLVKLVISLQENMMSHPYPERWASETIGLLSEDAEDVSRTPWGAEIMENYAERVRFINKTFLDIIPRLAEDSSLAMNYLPVFSDIQSDLDALLGRFSEGWDSVGSFLDTVEFPRLSPAKKTEAPELAETARSTKDRCFALLRNMKTCFSSSSFRLLGEMKASAPAMKALLDLTLEFDKQFRQEKMRLNLLDFSDLEHCTLEMLNAKPEIRRAVSDRYAEIMVDEYQDVSAIQDAIFSAVSGGGKKLFMVGDVKQSIYRFRLADPTIFIKKSREVSCIALNENYRSRCEVIDAVNCIFEKCMSARLGDIDYNDDARLKFGAKWLEGSVPEPELLIFERDPDEDTASYEAANVARHILKLRAEGYGFGDMAVLLRTANRTSAVYRSEFQKHGIPVDCSTGSDFFEQTEVSEIVNILRTIDNPNNDVALISALRTSSFSADELSLIRSCDKKHNMYSALQKCSSDKCQAFLEKLGIWRGCAREMTMDRLLTSLGCPVTPNLLLLIKMAVSFEEDGYHGIHRFITYLDRLSEKGEDLPDANLSGDAVHIMSIHKSKGLEFPVVFVCDTTHKFNDSDSRPVLVHSELGLGPRYFDLEAGVSYPTLARRAISLRKTSELKSEELRLLYVALTRAKDRLYMTACPKAGDIKIPASPSDAVCFFDWIVSSDIRKTTYPHLEDPGAPEVTEPEGAEPHEVPSIEYPYLSSVSIPASVTSSQLKSLPGAVSAEPHRYFRKPDFTGNSYATGAERGSAMHKALQFIDFSKDVSSEVSRLVEHGFISRRDASLIDISRIEAFIGSPLGQRIKKSPSVRREFKFLLLVSSKDLFDTDADEEVLLNGVVDCCFEEDGGIIVVDYKTDREDRSDEYAPQIRSYCTALSRVFGKQVREAYLYYINLGYEKRITV